MRMLILLLAACSAWGQTPVAIFPFPQHQATSWQLAGGAPFNSVALTASGDRYETCFQVPATGTLSKVGFRTNTVTTGDTVRISFQDVDAATGNADGTVDEYRSQVIGSADDNTWFTTGILSSDGTDGGVKRSVTIRDRICVVIDYASYVAGSINIASILMEGNSKGLPIGQAYNGRYTGGSWTKNANDGPNIALEYDGGVYYQIPAISTFSGASSLTYNSGSAADEAGNLIQYPVPVTAIGIWANFANTADVDLVLYDSSGTALGTATIDKDMVDSSSQKLIYGYFAGVALSANTTYYVMVKPTSATNLTVPYVNVNAAGILASTIGGSNVYSATRVDAGPFTTSQTRQYAVGLVLSSITGGSNGGSFIISQ